MGDSKNREVLEGLFGGGKLKLSAEHEYPVGDPISGRFQLYHHGEMRPVTEDECRGLEPVAALDYHHVVGRLMGGRRFGTGDLKGD